MGTIIVILIILVVSVLTYLKNKPLHFVVLIFITFLLSEFYPVDELNIKNVFKLGDLVILWLIYAGIKAPSIKTPFFKLPKLFFYLYSIWGLLIIMSLIMSLINQNVFFVVKMYRHFLWLFLPFSFFKLILTKNELLKFVNYFIILSVILSLLYSFQTFLPNISFLPNAGISESELGARVYGNTIMLNPITGPLALFLFLTLRKQKYWIFFLIITFAYMVTLGRGAITGYVAGSVISVFFINRHYSVLSKRIITQFTFLLLFVIIIAFTTNASQIYYSRFIEKTASNVDDEGDFEFSGRVNMFEKRLFWLENQGKIFYYIGAGRLYPSETLVFDTEIPPQYKTQPDVYLSAESGYFNGMLVYGIFGIGIWVITYLIMFFSIVKRTIKSTQRIGYEAIAISMIIFVLIAALSGIGFDEPLWISLIVIFTSVNFKDNTKVIAVEKNLLKIPVT